MKGYYEGHRDAIQRPAAWFTKDDCVNAHFHESVELVYVLDGEFHALLDGVNVVARAGEMVICGCYTVHAYEGIGTTAYIALIPMNAVPALRKRLTQGMFRSNVCRDDADETLRFLMRMLVEKQRNETVCQGICQVLLGELIDTVGVSAVEREPEGGALCKILSYLDGHYTEEVGVEVLSKEFGLSRSYISHLIRAGVGMSLPQYVNVLRCRWVTEQMLSTDRAILELALDAGYRNSRTFYTAYRSIYGMTPREYARSQQDEGV